MRIEIDDKYVITSDKRNVSLSKMKGIDKKGREVLKTIGHFSTLERLFQRLLMQKVYDSTATTLKQLKNDIEWAKKEVCALWEGV